MPSRKPSEDDVHRRPSITIEGNAALAALVEEMVLDGEPPANCRRVPQPPASCLATRHCSEAVKYGEVITGRPKLETLNVSKGGGLCTFAQLLDTMRGWPRLILEYVLLPATHPSPNFDATVGPNSTSSSTSEEEAAAPCPALKMAKITDTLDASKHFGFASFAGRTQRLRPIGAARPATRDPPRPRRGPACLGAVARGALFAV
ncbi:hypothetical protein DFH07DRAFT_960127 [Mycena maculata]|uniref:Uncharacterized protein n=1 Tax=Mycena maculata TaxID=230809 RepID=A0AAD7J2F3_9AGAR|nr:hypothetical protein DFH07DRAFT_960127 [Mycena maculata]